jgi:phosphoglycerate kinase
MQRNHPQSPLFLRTIDYFNLSQKQVLIRSDLNVPLSINQEIQDDTKIKAALPTIQYALSQGAKVIVASHLSSSLENTPLSLEPVAHRMAELLNEEVLFADTCYGDGIEIMAQSLKSGQLLLLENLRFYKQEQNNNKDFAKNLARLASIYINDAFSCSHRKHASLVQTPHYFTEKGVGFLFARDLDYFDQLINAHQKPFVFLFGGAHAADKLKNMQELSSKADAVLIAGKIANAFLAAQNKPVFSSVSEKEVITAASLIDFFSQKKIPLVIASDSIDGKDIGAKTQESFSAYLKTAKTCFWTGPLGEYQTEPYHQGSLFIADLLSKISATTIIAGAETVKMMCQFQKEESFAYLSTAGAASLEYLAHQSLPALSPLQYASPRKESTEKTAHE